MNNQFKTLLTIILFISVISCSVNSDITKVSESDSHFKDAVYEGKDFYYAGKEPEGVKYRIFHQASSGFSGTSGIRNSATIRAQKFCIQKNKKTMFKISEHTASPPYILGNFPRIEIIFTCLDKALPKEHNVIPNDKYDQIIKLKTLYDSGALTKDEFETEKKLILSK